MARDGASLGDEERLVAEAQRDPRRFGVLYERSFDVVYAFVARRVPSRVEAEDVTATVFYKALANLAGFQWRGVPFAAWLIRIASNEISDLRRSAPSAPLADVPVEVLSMRFGEDRPIAEVAALMGRSEGAVKQLQFRAIRALRDRMGDADE